jgi:hypothetical protein
MNNLNDTLKKYITMSPQTFSYAMIGLSTSVLVFFIAYKDDEPKSDESKVDESKVDESKVDESKSLPGEDEEQFDFDKNEEPMRMGDSRVGDSRVGGSRSSRVLDKSKHGKNTKTRKKGNKKHK